MAEEKKEESLWDRISRINVEKCGECGYVNALGSKVCLQCGAQIESDDDEEAVDMVAGAGIQSAKAEKIPLDRAKNLIQLRDAAEGIQAGKISLEEYRQAVSRILYISQTGVMVFETDLVKKKIAELPREEAELAARQYGEFKKFNQGVNLMSKFLESSDMSCVKQGFAQALAAMEELDRIQDLQLEIVNLRKQG